MNKLIKRYTDGRLWEVYFAPYSTRSFRVDPIDGRPTGGIDGLSSPDGKGRPYLSIVDCINAINAEITDRINNSEYRDDCRYYLDCTAANYTDTIQLPACGYLYWQSRGCVFNGNISLDAVADDYDPMGTMSSVLVIDGATFKGEFNITKAFNLDLTIRFRDCIIDNNLTANGVYLLFENSELTYNGSISGI